MTHEPEDPLEYRPPIVIDGDPTGPLDFGSVELTARRDLLALALELVRSASAVTIAVALVVIAFALT